MSQRGDAKHNVGLGVDFDGRAIHEELCENTRMFFDHQARLDDRKVVTKEARCARAVVAAISEAKSSEMLGGI
eukprot:6212425-Pleurochrysis_carterae.AAC.3